MTERAQEIKDKMDRIMVNREDINKLIEDRKGYGFDSLALRYNTARDAQAEYEVRFKKVNPDSAYKMAQRDKMRFYEILTDLIGEHK